MAWLKARTAWTYSRDDATDFRRGAQKAITDQKDDTIVKVGGSLAAGTVPQHPHGLKPRVALVQSAAGARRRVVCYEVDAPLYIGTTSTINLDVDGASVAFTRYGAEGERIRGGEQDQA
jgi:hypothetical protein